LFGLTTFFACSPFLHYFAVSEQKTEIRGKLTASITQAENMFTEYERYAKNRENLYESKLRSVAAAKNISPKEFNEYGFINNIPVDKQIENKMVTVHIDLFLTNYKEMEQAGSDWLINARNIVNSWNWTSIINVVNEVEKNSNDWLNTLVGLSAIREKGEQAEDFTYDLSFDDVKNHFITLGKPTLLSIGLVIAAYLLMLLSWIVTKRHPKFPGLKIIFCTADDLIGKNKDEVIL
jgi:hypothetical protein